MASSSDPQAEAPTISVTNSLITGGNYTQHLTYYVTQNELPREKSTFELLWESIAHTAFHNAGERFNAPRCHPNTRTVVIKNIMDWILRRAPTTRNALIMWLYGAAGAGKTAIAQTIAEMCDDEGSLVGSFFFSRSDRTRNHVRTLFPTLSYQLGEKFPELRHKLFSIIENDPLIFRRSLPMQFSSLIMEPLQELVKFHQNRDFSRRLVVIDGLDDCLDPELQCQVLDLISSGTRSPNFPLMFLIATRPQHDISARFNSFGMSFALNKLALQNDAESHRDIELFLRDKFGQIVETHPFKQSIPPSWPEESVMQHLVLKSSGQFIYPATVIKYVGSSKRLPHYQLEVIMQTRPTDHDEPFAELDALYRHIFSALDDTQAQLVVHILSFYFIPPYDLWNVYSGAKILGVEPAELVTQFCGLTSIISLDPHDGDPWLIGSPQKQLHFLHSALTEFLLDSSRSGRIHINLVTSRPYLIQKCIQFLTYQSFHKPEIQECVFEAMFFLRENLEGLLSANLQRDILFFSIPRIFGELLVAPTVTPLLFPYFLTSFLPDFLETLKQMDESQESLYMYHLRCFDATMSQHVEVYYSSIHLTLLLVLVDFFITTRKDIDLNWELIFTDELKSLHEIDNRHLILLDTLCRPAVASPTRYYPLIHGYLINPSRSGKFRLDGEKYARAALAILFYLHRQPSLTTGSESALPDVLSFVLQRASRSEELIASCHRLDVYNFPDSGNADDNARVIARQAAESYLQKTCAGAF